MKWLEPTICSSLRCQTASSG